MQLIEPHWLRLFAAALAGGAGIVQYKDIHIAVMEMIDRVRHTPQKNIKGAAKRAVLGCTCNQRHSLLRHALQL